MTQWELVTQVGTTTPVRKPLVDYPEWELEKSADMPLERFSGMAKIFFQSTTKVLSKIQVVQVEPEQGLV